MIFCGLLVFFVLFLVLVQWNSFQEEENVTRGRIPRLAIITCVWERKLVTEFVLRFYSELRSYVKSSVELELFAAISEEVMISRCEKFGWKYVMTENHPLGKKWNTILHEVYQNDHEMFDAVMTVGSDDILTPRSIIDIAEMFLSQVEDDWSERTIVAGFEDVYFVDVASMNVSYNRGYAGLNREGEPVGAGRTMHRKVLESLNWQLWDDHLEHALDLSAWKRMKKKFPNILNQVMLLNSRKREEWMVVDFKTKENIWSFSDVSASKLVTKIDIPLCHKLDKLWWPGMCDSFKNFSTSVGIEESLEEDDE